VTSKKPRQSFGTAEGRWAGFGPYYAMFPTQFAKSVVARFSLPGQLVLDPFAGRGTAVFSAATQNRYGIGIEINPVGWVYSRTKLNPAPSDAVLARTKEIWSRRHRHRGAAQTLPKFFSACFCDDVASFLVSARAELDWRRNGIDRTLMAFLLTYLHGKRHQALSNQMRQTKAMSPQYAMRWWAERALRPPRLDPVHFLTQRIEWRYALGVPSARRQSQTYYGSSTRLLRTLGPRIPKRASLLFTSPPYFALTNYHYDQWLRLWLLGEAPNAKRKPGRHRAKFENSERYATLLLDVFGSAAPLLTENAVIYVRTGLQSSTYQPTRAALKEAFPKHHIARRLRPFKRPTQTSLFGDRSPKPGEVDLILTR
jgi:hypothetical protein